MYNNNEKKKNIKSIVIAALGIGAALLIVLIVVHFADKGGNKTEKGTEENAQSGTATPTLGPTAVPFDSDPYGTVIYYDGKQYVYNTDLFNVLFIGIDKRDVIEVQDKLGKGGQSDALMLLSMNKKTQEVNILQICRDSMVNIEVYDLNGNFLYSRFAHLTLQYAYGNGRETSCQMTKQRVEELLYQTPIDGYVALDIDAIRIINDAVGGVEITIPEDYTMIDPSFIKGETVTLTGEQAEKYVRYRDTSVLGSNTGRMERQVQYIPALITKFRSKFGGEGLYEKFYPLIKDYMVTDLSADQIDELGNYNLNTENTQFVPGEYKNGKIHDEFYVNNDELQKILIKMLYKEK